MRRMKLFSVSAALAALALIVVASKTKLWAQSTTGTAVLFNYVTNQANFDSKVVISNTTMDPLGTTPTAGTCTLNYYGNTNGGIAPPAQQSTAVQPGTQLTFTLSGGGDHGISATPGFSGYIIASCGFPFAQGTATISDVGGQKYMSLVPGLVLSRGSLVATGQ